MILLARVVVTPGSDSSVFRLAVFTFTRPPFPAVDDLVCVEVLVVWAGAHETIPPQTTVVAINTPSNLLKLPYCIYFLGDCFLSRAGDSPPPTRAASLVCSAGCGSFEEVVYSQQKNRSY